MRRTPPDDATFATALAETRGTVLRAARRRPARRFLPFVAGAVVAAGVGGGAVAIIRTDVVPETPVGDSIVRIGSPAPGDRWLNLSVAFSCVGGGRLRVLDGSTELVAIDCDRDFAEDTDEETSAPDDGGNGHSPSGAGDGSHPPQAVRAPSRATNRGMSKAVPVTDVTSDRLVVESTLDRRYLVQAVFSPTSQTALSWGVPTDGPDGTPDWQTPSWPVNEHGLTVGMPSVGAPPGVVPDLVPTWFEGRRAYFRGSDYLGTVVLDLDEAREQVRRDREEGLLDDDGTIYRWVYAADGRTRLGKVVTGSSR